MSPRTLARLPAPLMAGLLIGACGDDAATGPDPAEPASVEVKAAFDSLFVDEARELEATVYDAHGVPLDIQVTWSSSTPEVAQVDAGGTVEGRGVGFATVRAEAGTVAGEVGFDVVKGVVPISELVSGEFATEMNPSGRAPLAALLTLATTEDAIASYVVPGRTREMDYQYAEDRAGTSHVLPILGLRPGIENAVKLRVETRALRADTTLPFPTAELPDFLPTVTVHGADIEAMEPGWNLASLSIGNAGTFEGHPLMFDANGDVRWYLDLSELGGMVFALEPLANGNLITGHRSNLYEYDLLGREVRSWAIGGFIYHHDVIEAGDGGNLIVAVDVAGRGTVEDHIIEVDRATGAVVRQWDLRAVLDVTRSTWVEHATDWFHMNSVWYDERDGSLIVSGRNQSAVVKLSKDNELLWILSAHEGWSEPWSDYLLTAIDENGDPYPAEVQAGAAAPGPEFRWPWGQHAAMYLPDGTLFLFDNGLRRRFGTAAGEYFSRGVEYAIDEEARTIRQVWQYGEERGPSFYSEIISDVDHLPETGNRLILPGLVQNGTKALVSEVTYPSGALVFDAELTFRNALGSGAGWGEIDLVYRSERLVARPPR